MVYCSLRIFILFWIFLQFKLYHTIEKVIIIMVNSIFLYVPNLIGYSRVILMFLAYIVADKHCLLFGLFYFLSQFLDMFDGMAARHFEQSTNFGAMLDMVTDRCSTVGLLMTISNRYPNLTIYCHIFIWLDIFSHWCHMLASLRAGAGSHKNVKTGPKLLQYYYKTKWFMVLLIFGAEGLPLALYFNSWEFKCQCVTTLIHIIILACAPLFFMKHFINVIQFVNASLSLDKK